MKLGPLRLDFISQRQQHFGWTTKHEMSEEVGRGIPPVAGRIVRTRSNFMQSKIMVQPQAQTGSTLQWEMAGGDGVGSGGQGSLRVPPELAENEVVSRLFTDNHQLREALRRSNVALRERCEDMEKWQQLSRKEKEFLTCRFQEAKALVERLSQEKQDLWSQLNQTDPRAQAGSPILPQTNNLNCLEKLEDREGKEEDRTSQQTPPESVAYSSVCSSVSTVFPSLAESLTPPEGEAWGEGEGGAGSKPADGSNQFLKLLKSHKEKLEENLRELRDQKKELEVQKEKVELERDRLLSTNEQLQQKLMQMQGGSVTEETVQQSPACAEDSDTSQVAKLMEELQITQSRCSELQEKYDSLQKTTAQLDKTEARLKQRDKEFEQITKDSEALKAQVTSLLGELHERQSCLDKSEVEGRLLQERLTAKTEALQIKERDMETMKKQHSVTVDQLRLQNENKETALKTERMLVTEEKRKLAQLQQAYTQLFTDYDTKLRNGGEVEDKLREAEMALVMKQDLIDKLKEELEQQRMSLETVPVLAAQAEIFKADFLAEREARETLNQRKEELQEQLNKAVAEIDLLKVGVTSRARMEEMQQRHMGEYRALPTSGGMVSEELPDYRCPKCQYQAPDIDTLQIHVMDCIQ
ncbi:optineurin isoform X3 [Paramormyrops kingsleyae]|uniref:optineurin isoform X3 n=1 Tax=Paramormyrops kingsleyae TaxID=1676925 RepID=UPI003B96A369